MVFWHTLLFVIRSVLSGSLWLGGLYPQVPPSMKFSRQEYWSRLPFPSPCDLLNPEIEPRSPILQEDSLLPEPLGKSNLLFSWKILLTFIIIWMLKFLLLFWLHHTVCGSSAPRPGIAPRPSAVKVQGPNHRTSREFPAGVSWKLLNQQILVPFGLVRLSSSAPASLCILVQTRRIRETFITSAGNG